MQELVAGAQELKIALKPEQVEALRVYQQELSAWNNRFNLTVCVTVVLKILAQVEILVPSYGFCPIPPCEEFAENVCDEFFSLPLFPPASLCNNEQVSITNPSCTISNNCNRCCGNR